jgi:hypothetical protein
VIPAALEQRKRGAEMTVGDRLVTRPCRLQRGLAHQLAKEGSRAMLGADGGEAARRSDLEFGEE